MHASAAARVSIVSSPLSRRAGAATTDSICRAMCRKTGSGLPICVLSDLADKAAGGAGFFERQGNEYRTAAAEFAFQPRAAAVQFGQTAHQRQPQARASRLTVKAVVHLVEGLEDIVDLFARDARTVVAHHD